MFFFVRNKFSCSEKIAHDQVDRWAGPQSNPRLGLGWSVRFVPRAALDFHFKNNLADEAQGVPMTLILEDELSLESLVLRAQAQDREAFGELVVRTQSFVEAVARKRVRNQHDVAELVQDVFLHAMRKIHQLREPACLLGWLRQITIRLAINRGTRRALVKTIDCEILAESAGRDESPADEFESAESRSEIREAIGRLKPIDRDVLIAFHLQERSVASIAQEFEIPVGTVKRRLHVARKRLEECLTRCSQARASVRAGFSPVQLTSDLSTSDAADQVSSITSSNDSYTHTDAGAETRFLDAAPVNIAQETVAASSAANQPIDADDTRLAATSSEVLGTNSSPRSTNKSATTVNVVDRNQRESVRVNRRVRNDHSPRQFVNSELPGDGSRRLALRNDDELRSIRMVSRTSRTPRDGAPSRPLDTPQRSRRTRRAKLLVASA